MASDPAYDESELLSLDRLRCRLRSAMTPRRVI